MLLDDDVMGHGKAEPRSLPCWLCGEEGNEYLFLYFGRDAGAIVANADFDRLAEVPRGCAENRLKAFVTGFDLAPDRGIEAIGNQVEQRARDLLRIQFKRSCERIEVVL